MVLSMSGQVLLVIVGAALLPCVKSAPPTVSAERSQVWGPGLRAQAALPARYFFIQAVDSQGNNFTDSPPVTFQVNIFAPGEQYTRVGVQVLDRKDGSLIVRYKLYASYKSLQVEVTANGKHVARSPYMLEGPIYNEECYCPESNSDRWLQHMTCKESIPQIEHNLRRFSSVDPDKISVEIPERFGQRQSLCHYTIKDNKIYIKTYGEHVGFRIFMDSLLLSLTSKVKVPDIEFFVNLGDWPLEKRKGSNVHPIFSWCGSTDSKDIVMPTYDLTDSVLETMGRVSLDMLSVQANTGPRWENKNNTAFWRGRDSSKERLELVMLGRKHPEMLDAAFTHFFFFKHNESLYGPIRQPIAFYDFFKISTFEGEAARILKACVITNLTVGMLVNSKQGVRECLSNIYEGFIYKYQILIDGTVAAYRAPYLFAGNSVILKQDSIYYEHFYNELQPWKHYVPFKKDLSDLLEKIQWVKDHDAEAKKIAQAGQEYARHNLMGEDVFCYYFKLFQAYARLQVNEPKIREGMEPVEQTSDNLFPCDCHRNKGKDEL